MKKKTILILGGTLMQVPVIQSAKFQGYYVITADYLPNNIGHKFADEYFNVSTTDKEGILQLARQKNIDGILAYASDPAAPTAAFVSEQIGLPGNKYSVVNMMSNKTLFRQFLYNNHFPTPENHSFNDYDSFKSYINKINYPVIIKPVDSSGSKGISIIINRDINFKTIYNNAIEYSRKKEIIVEKIIEGNQLHGDAFVENGNLIMMYLGDQNFDDSINKLVPCYTIWPSKSNENVISHIENQIQEFIQLSGFKNGGLNIEIRIEKETGIPYIIEIGPRNGGHFTPDTIHYATNFDFAKNSVNVALGEKITYHKTINQGYFANLILHSNQTGIYKGITFKKELENKIIEYHIYKNEGDIIYPYNGSNTAIGVAIVKFNNYTEAIETLNNAYKYYIINLA